MYKFSSFALIALAIGSCRDKDPSPQPPCYTGVVVGFTCTDGPLIDVDPAYPIGAPALVPRNRFALRATGDTLLGRNVIAVVNADVLSSFGNGNMQGKRFYFTYANDPKRQSNGYECAVFDGVNGSIPHLVLSNVFTKPCAAH